MRIAVAGGTGTVGRHVVASAEAAGHEVVVLARSTGIDLATGRGLQEALAGCGAVVDVSSIGTLATKASVDFFTTATNNLLAAEKAAGVAHHVALSIIGASQAGNGYYAGKTAQEQLVMGSSRPWSVLRAAQFHEFAAQMAARPQMLGLALVPKMRSQPVAAAEVGAALVEIAVGRPRGLDRDLAGPREENMADMVRRYLAAAGRKGRVVQVALPGGMGRVMKSGGLLAGPEARLGTQTYEEWLRSPDARVR